jgi:hypothetical protein
MSIKRSRLARGVCSLLSSCRAIRYRERGDLTKCTPYRAVSRFRSLRTARGISATEAPPKPRMKPGRDTSLR